jgi:hypothetical protein
LVLGAFAQKYYQEFLAGNISNAASREDAVKALEWDRRSVEKATPDGFAYKCSTSQIQITSKQYDATISVSWADLYDALTIQALRDLRWRWMSPWPQNWTTGTPHNTGAYAVKARWTDSHDTIFMILYWAGLNWSMSPKMNSDVGDALEIVGFIKLPEEADHEN